MANQAFRDVNTVSIFGTNMLGVERVTLEDDGAVINWSADAAAYRQDVGLTKQLAMVSIEKKASNKMRDLISAVFTCGSTGSVTLGRVQRVRAREGGTPLHDSGDADTWIRYVGVTEVMGEVEVTSRDVKQRPSAGTLVKGRKGTLTVTVPIQRTGYGLPASTATETHKFQCMVAKVGIKAEHGNLADLDLRFEIYGPNRWTASGATGGASLAPVAVGATGTISWKAPAADASSAESVTVARNCVVEREMTVEHGSFARSSIRTEAGSSDGVTPPIS